MAEAVLMPKAGISVESCIICSWRVKVGDSVAVGDILFEYETDKAVFECGSPAAGTILAVFFEAGDEVAVLTPVCVIGSMGEDYSALARAVPSAGKTALPSEATAALLPTPQTAKGTVSGVSPRARALSDRQNLDAARAEPTGPSGRVIERDIAALGERIRAGFAAPPPSSPQSAAVSSAQGYTDVPFTRIRHSIASAMFESLRNTAQLTHHHRFDAASLFACRAELKAAGISVTVNDLILFAVSRVLPNHPDFNAHMLPDGTTLRRFGAVNLGIATDTPRGLMVPTIFGADRLSLVEISAQARDLIACARSGSINPDLLRDGTFTVTNLGSLGVLGFTPILNPPQVGILGVGAAETGVRRGENGIEYYDAIPLSFTYDHRAADGAPAARFINELIEGLEHFTALLSKS